MMAQGALQGFADYLAQNRLARPAHIPFLVRRVEQFLRGEARREIGYEHEEGGTNIREIQELLGHPPSHKATADKQQRRDDHDLHSRHAAECAGGAESAGCGRGMTGVSAC